MSTFLIANVRMLEKSLSFNVSFLQELILFVHSDSNNKEGAIGTYESSQCASHLSVSLVFILRCLPSSRRRLPRAFSRAIISSSLSAEAASRVQPSPCFSSNQDIADPRYRPTIYIVVSSGRSFINLQPTTLKMADFQPSSNNGDQPHIIPESKRQYTL